MTTDRPPQPSLVSLTDVTMIELSMSARLLWVLLSARATSSEPTRLNLRRVKAAAFPFDPAVTVGSLEMDVLALEDAGFLSTMVGVDGRERYMVHGLDAAEDEPPIVPYQPVPSRLIASVGGGGSERGREGASEGATADPGSEIPPPHRPIPQRFCPRHRSGVGSGGVSCGECGDYRMEFTAFMVERQHRTVTPPDPPRAEPVDEQPPLFRRPRFRPTDAADTDEDPDDPWNLVLPF